MAHPATRAPDARTIAARPTTAILLACITITLLPWLVGCPEEPAGTGGTNVNAPATDNPTAAVLRVADDYAEAAEDIGDDNERRALLERYDKKLRDLKIELTDAIEETLGVLPAADDLLLYTYFKIVGDDLEALAKRTNRDGGIAHVAAIQFEHYAAREGRLAATPGLLGNLIDGLDTNALVDDPREHRFRPVWTIAAERATRMTGVAFGVRESTRDAPDLARRRELWRTWFELNRVYLYSYTPPDDALGGVSATPLQLDHEAINAGLGTIAFRQQQPWPVSAHPNQATGYGSPTYAPTCFAAWDQNATRYSLYESNRQDYLALPN